MGSSSHLCRGQFNCLADSNVGHAAANTARHHRVNVTVTGIGKILQQRGCLHDLSRLAIPGLRVRSKVAPINDPERRVDSIPARERLSIWTRMTRRAMKQAATRIAIEMRRMIVFLSNQSRSFYYNSVSLPDPLAALEVQSSIQSHRSENRL